MESERSVVEIDMGHAFCCCTELVSWYNRTMKNTAIETKQMVALVTVSCWLGESFAKTARRYDGRISDGTRNDLAAADVADAFPGERGHYMVEYTVRTIEGRR